MHILYNIHIISKQIYFSEVTGLITKLRENISMIKKLKTRNRRKLFFLIEKIICKESKTNTILNEETVSDFLLRAERSLGCPLSPLLFSIVFNTSFGFSIYSTMLSANGDHFTSFFPL